MSQSVDPVIVDFVKMHGAGNDFIVMDARATDFPFEDVRQRTPDLCHRRTGIGADGILMLRTSDDSDFTMHYLNADGSEAGMCGNGARCLARFAAGLGMPDKLRFHVGKHHYKAEVHDEYVSILFPMKPRPVKRVIDGVDWYEIHSGTEHVVSVDPKYMKASDATFRKTGCNIRNRIDLFPAGTNVNFASVINQNGLRLVTYERGVEDLTLACGTGAIATAIAHIFINLRSTPPDDKTQFKEHHIQVECPGGPLEVSFNHICSKSQSTFENIVLHGPAVAVYQGQFTL